MSKQYKPNIVRGGIAVPLGNNYFFMKGRKHKQGGIDVGKDLEVEDGEIMKLSPKEVKVFSAVPFLNGQSPVEKLLGGENPNKVFAQQERFKKVNKINDDGTKAQLGKGKKITTTEIPESQQYAVTTPDGQRKVFNSKQEATNYVTANTPKGYSLYDITNYGSNIDKGQTDILNRNTEREIEKATEQEKLTATRLANRQQNQENAKELLSYTPVIGDAMDMYNIGKDAYNGNYLNAGIGLGLLALPNAIEKPIKYVGKGIKKLFTKQPDWGNIIKQIDKLEPINFPKEKTYIPDQIDLESSKRLNDFWNNIFMGKYASNRDRINKNKIFREPISGKFISIKSTDPKAIKGAAGHSSEGNAYIYSDINPIGKDEIVIHEGAHNFRDTDKASLIARTLNKGKDKSLLYSTDTHNYTANEINNLTNAYNFTDEYRFNVLKNDARRELGEKAATNTQLQYHLYNKYGVKSIGELNEVIDNLPDDDLLYDLMQTNGYGVDFVKNIATLSPQVKKERVNAIRNALKYVPATIGATTGLSLINNNDQNIKLFGGRTKAPLGILKKIGQSLGIIKEDKKTYTNDIHWGIKQDIKNGKIHIGGKPNEARQKYFDLDKEFSDSVKAVSKRYGLNPNLVASRIAKEGPIDYGIELVNNSVGFNREQMDGPFWGLDDLGTHLAEGRVTIKEPWNRIKSNRYFTNEKGRDTNSVYSTEWVDGIYGTAAELKYRRDYMKKHFPDMTDEQLDAAATASFNRGNYGARKWINNKGNYMQYKPFIKLKKMGGNYNDKNGKWLQKNGKIVTIADKNRFTDKHDIYPMSTKVIKDGNRKTIVNVPDTVTGPKILRPFVHLGRRMTNTATEMFKRNRKPMGGNHKLNTNQMANIYRVDSNGKTTWGMNFSTGDKSKSRQKAEIGLKTKNDGSYYGYPKKDNKGNTWYIPTDEDLKLMYPGLAEDVDYNALSDYDKRRYDEREGVREGYRVLPTGGIFYSDDETIFVNDEIDVNREIPNSKLRRKYWNNLSTYEDRLNNQVEPNKTNVVTPSKIKSTTNNKSVNYSVTNKKQTTPKQIIPNVSTTTTTSKLNVTNNPINITTSNNVIRTTPKAKSNSQEIPIFGLDAQNAFKKSIVGSKANPDYIRGTFDFRDNKELVNKVDPSTIKVNPTNIKYKGTPSSGGYFKNYNAGDYISLGANVLGNIGSALINKHTLDNMKYTSAPVPKMTIKQKTNFNINPQLDLSRERLREGISDVNTNTASSSTALNRNNKLRLANIMNTNQLYGTKENMETQLINADRMNQQNVFNSNIDTFNTWNKEKNIFETAKQEKYGENKVGAVQGISQAVHDFINNNEKRRQFNNNLIAIMAANPNNNPEYLKALGADWITDERIRNWKLANKK